METVAPVRSAVAEHHRRQDMLAATSFLLEEAFLNAFRQVSRTKPTRHEPSKIERRPGRITVSQYLTTSHEAATLSAVLGDAVVRTSTGIRYPY